MDWLSALRRHWIRRESRLYYVWCCTRIPLPRVPGGSCRGQCSSGGPRGIMPDRLPGRV